MAHMDDYPYDEDTARGLAIGVIVAIALSVFFFVIVLPLLCCCLWFRRKKRLERRNKEGSEAYARMQAQRAAQGTAYPMGAYPPQYQAPAGADMGGTPIGGYYGEPPKDVPNAYHYGPAPQTQGVQQTT